MTQEEKDLLLKDLSARLPYGVKICYIEPEYEIKSTWNVDYIYPNGNIVCKNPYGIHFIENCRLYLRPMSSMTEEEDKEFALWQVEAANSGFLFPVNAGNVVDWLLSHHFDYRGLIKKGLALEAPEGMYK